MQVSLGERGRCGLFRPITPHRYTLKHGANYPSNRRSRRRGWHSVGRVERTQLDRADLRKEGRKSFYRGRLRVGTGALFQSPEAFGHPSIALHVSALPGGNEAVERGGRAVRTLREVGWRTQCCRTRAHGPSDPPRPAESRHLGVACRWRPHGTPSSKRA